VSPAKWQKGGIESTDKVDKVVILPGGTNLNTVTTSGFYRLGTGNTNGPTSSDNNQLIVIHGGGDTITQILGNHTTGALWTRSGNPSDVGGSGTWTAWRALAFTDSPVFTGNPTAPTPAAGNSNTSLATAAFTQQEITSRALDFTSDPTVLKTAQLITNIHAVRKTGIYMGSDVANGLSGWWYYHVIVHNSVPWIKVIAYYFDTAACYVKTCANGTWSGWVQLTDANGAAAAVAGMTFSLAANGYYRLPTSGIIVQWVTGATTFTGDQDQTIWFPISFPNLCLHLMVSTRGGAANNTDGWFQERSTSAASCVVNSQWTGSGSFVNGIQPKIIAIGY
jgi:hypothetical protein